jgi:hypothetical protein
VFYFFFHVCRVIGKPETWIYNFDATHQDDKYFFINTPQKGGLGAVSFQETREYHVSKHWGGYKEENNMKKNIFTPKVCSEIEPYSTAKRSHFKAFFNIYC